MRILLGSMVVAGLLLSGCGKKKDDSSPTGGDKTGDTGGKKAAGGGGGGGGATADAIVGTWSMDAEALKKIMFEEMKKQPGFPPDTTMDNPMVAAGLAMADQIKMTFEVKGDGTWAGTGTNDEGQNEAIKGTWKKVGTEYEMTIESADEGPKTGTATITGGKLNLQAPGVPFPFVFKRG